MAKQTDTKRLQQALNRLHKAVGSVESALHAGHAGANVNANLGGAAGGGGTAPGDPLDANQGNLGLGLNHNDPHTASEIKAIEDLLNRAITLLASDDDDSPQTHASHASGDTAHDEEGVHKE
ncbi:MAG: hypothetical protein MJE68_15260 [Proteobacteria bacterium]|nr:hypothetical protein [Pseudomonadota bacterium]